MLLLYFHQKWASSSHLTQFKDAQQTWRYRNCQNFSVGVLEKKTETLKLILWSFLPGENSEISISREFIYLSNWDTVVSILIAFMRSVLNEDGFWCPKAVKFIPDSHLDYSPCTWSWLYACMEHSVYVSVYVSRLTAETIDFCRYNSVCWMSKNLKQIIFFAFVRIETC